MKEAHAHHGHVIVPKRTLVTVLAILLFFTALTVFAANAEGFIAHAFGVELPQWMNVAVALSIAIVKTIIVAMYFMQLRYDNPMNSAIAIFTLMVLCCFLGFTMIDLGARDALASYKAVNIEAGGTGGVKRMEPRLFDDKGNYDPTGSTLEEITVSGSITEFARKRAKDQIAALEAAHIPRDKWPRTIVLWAEHFDHDAHEAHEAALANSSNANQSRPRTGITLPELMDGSAGHGAHAPAGGAHEEKKDEPAKPGH